MGKYKDMGYTQVCAAYGCGYKAKVMGKCVNCYSYDKYWEKHKKPIISKLTRHGLKEK